MTLVKHYNDIIGNLETLENYLNSDSKEEKAFAQQIIASDTTILVYKFGGETHYAPSSFCAYQNNSLEIDGTIDKSDIKSKDKALGKVLPGKARPLAKKEEEYLSYCKAIKAKPANNSRLYWRVGTSGDPYMDIAKLLKD